MIVTILSYIVYYTISCIIAWFFDYEPGKDGFKVLRNSLIWPYRLFRHLIKRFMYNLNPNNFYRIKL